MPDAYPDAPHKSGSRPISKRQPKDPRAHPHGRRFVTPRAPRAAHHVEYIRHCIWARTPAAHARVAISGVRIACSAPRADAVRGGGLGLGRSRSSGTSVAI